MQEIIAKVIADARTQSLEQLSDTDGDDEREESEDEVYCYSGSDRDTDSTPKGQRH